MRRFVFLPALLCVAAALPPPDAAIPEPDFREIDRPPHEYHSRVPRDGFTKLKDDLESGRIALDRSNEKAFVTSLLGALGIPVSSQMLVFSTTSLQLKLISPANPRALYFNDEIYLGWVPGGRIEVLSLDPELGGIFHIFDPPRGDAPLHIERSERCMNCHAGDDTGRVPGLVMKSVIAGEHGGSLKAFRIEQTGHAIPFAERFGGWFVTGDAHLSGVLGNVVGHYVDGAVVTRLLAPGTTFDFARYPVTTSDVLPQLILEHQAGFVNRVVQAGYRARTYLYADAGVFTAAHAQVLDEQARIVVRYLLFADEAPLPNELRGDPAYVADFLKTRVVANNGASLKDLDLRTRLFCNRCSYMIYTPLFTALPPALKERIFAQLAAALDSAQPAADYAYLPAAEKQSIREILRTTIPDLAGWPAPR